MGRYLFFFQSWYSFSSSFACTSMYSPLHNILRSILLTKYRGVTIKTYSNRVNCFRRPISQEGTFLMLHHACIMHTYISPFASPSHGAPLHLLFQKSTLYHGNSIDPFIRNSSGKVPSICHIQGPPTGILLQAPPSAELIFQYRVPFEFR
jgi:hypothetical protein